MDDFPKYSVLLSIYYKENPEWLRNAFESVENQTVPPSEVVLVEDGPLNKQLEDVIEEFRQRLPNFKIVALPQNKGLGLALQEGIAHCSYELVARMDTDDVAAPERCEKQLKKFVEEPELDVVGCWENEFWGDSIKSTFSCHRVPESDEEIKKFMRRRCALLHPTVIFKKSAVLRAGNYQHRLLFEDYDLFARMVRTGSKCYNVQEALYYLRVNPMLFKRRGGLKYAKTLLKFKYEMYKNGFSSRKDFLVSGFGHYCVCLMPNTLRILFYKLFLR